jgi:hypothetical protein
MLLAAPLAAQSPPTPISQTKAPSAAQQPQTVVKPTAKPAQPHIITFTAEQLDEYENKILNQAEVFYNDRMAHLLWTMGIIMAAGLAIVGILIPMILEWQRKISFAKELAQADEKILKSTKKQIKELETGLISQIDAREEEQTKAIGSNLAYIFTAMGGLFMPMQAWDMVLKSFFIAIRFSIDGQCLDSCFNATVPHIIHLLEKPETTNSLTLEILCDSDKDIEDIKVRLDKITDTEQRVRMKSQIKDLQMTIHALTVKKRQDSDTVSPQTKPQEDEKK